MAFNKISMVILVLFAVATMANARVHPSAVPFLRRSGSDPVTEFSCECFDVEGETKCYLIVSSGGGICPAWCRNLCACTLKWPPESNTCWCSSEVESCGEALKSTAVAPKLQAKINV